MHNDPTTHDSPTDNTPAGPEQLNAIEARIIGSLIEKQTTTPDQYPLTQNSLLLACNQKSNREPQMNLSSGDVGHSLRVLENRHLVRVDMGARTDRYEQTISTTYRIDKKQQILLAIMLLRGPQTLNELYSRSQRTQTFADTDDIRDTLARMIERSEPIVQQIPRQSGQREDRYMHLLSGTPQPLTHTAQRPAQASAQAQTEPQTSTARELEARVAVLEEQVAQLTQQLTQLTQPTNDNR